MSKVVTKRLFDFQALQIMQPIRQKLDYVNLIMYAARTFLLQYEEPNDPNACQIKLVIDKMSRLFVFHEEKFFSVAFPFHVSLSADNSIAEINSLSKRIVDNASISGVLSIINNKTFQLHPSPLEHWNRLESYEVQALELLEEIFTFEPGYIRYDHDPERENGKLHPLHHLDINYSGYGTFKVGVKKQLHGSTFEDILNILTDCSFLD